MPQLTREEADAFLDEPGHLLRLATIDADGFPRLVPIWFIRRDDEILFTPRGPSVFLGNIRRDPRVALSIDEDPLPYRKVTVQGTARIVHDLGADDEWRELYRTIAKRYVPADGADAYVDNTIDQPRALVGVPNQLTSNPNSLLISPKSVLNMSRQTMYIANAGIAYGRISSTRRSR